MQLTGESSVLAAIDAIGGVYMLGRNLPSIDLYEEAPSEGWPRWMENQIREADYVLVLCSKSYYDKFYSDKKGKGVTWKQCKGVPLHLFSQFPLRVNFSNLLVGTTSPIPFELHRKMLSARSS